MNSVFLTGYLDSPIQVMSGENTPLHIKTAIKVTHFTAAGIRKDDVFTLSVWRGTAKRFMEQARIGSSITLQGYLSTQLSKDGPVTEVTVSEFRIANKEIREKATIKSAAVIIADTESKNESVKDQVLESNDEE